MYKDLNDNYVVSLFCEDSYELINFVINSSKNFVLFIPKNNK